MEKIIRLALIGLFGFIAQLVDGSLGMGYGVTSTSLLLSIGYGTAISSAIVHFSEIFTTLSSGLFHIKFGNIDKKIFKYLVFSGVVGGMCGALAAIKLQNIDVIRPIVSLLLLCLGLLIIVRHFSKNKSAGENYSIPRIRKLVPLGFVAAFTDAIGGGGWGPIATPSLVATNTDPKKTIGSVSLAEFFVTLTISITFLLALPKFDFSIMIPLTIGALIASPIAAILTRKINHKTLSAFVGVAITLLSVRTILKYFGFWFFF
jgi:uncharacterized membrane protein YfcA